VVTNVFQNIVFKTVTSCSIKVRVKVKLSVCLTKYDAIKTYQYLN